MSLFATDKILALSLSLMLIKAVPEEGNLFPAAIWALANAAYKSLSIPITSPVDFISGPNMVSTLGNLINGNTDSFTQKWSISKLSGKPNSSKDFPAIILEAIFAKGTPTAFEINGTVLLARGFTSIIKTFSSLIAYWIFKKPFTLSFNPIFLVFSFISFITFSDKE